MKNFYQYTGPTGQPLHGYERQYKTFQLRKKGFVTKSDAEKDLRQAMNDIDATERGEIRTNQPPPKKLSTFTAATWK